MKNIIKTIKNLKTSYKLIISFSLIILLTAILGALAHKSLKNLNQKYLNLHEGIIKRYSLLDGIDKNIIKLQLSHNELITELNNKSTEKNLKNDLESIILTVLNLSKEYNNILLNSYDIPQAKKKNYWKNMKKLMLKFLNMIQLLKI